LKWFQNLQSGLRSRRTEMANHMNRDVNRRITSSNLLGSAKFLSKND
jgi:hypothetical protein